MLEKKIINRRARGVSVIKMSCIGNSSRTTRYLQQNVVPLRPFQRPLAIAEGCILVRVIRALHDVAAARHVILAVSRAVQLVGIIAAVILLVALERRVDALAVRAVERTCDEQSSLRVPPPGPSRSGKFRAEPHGGCFFSRFAYRTDRRWHDT